MIKNSSVFYIPRVFQTESILIKITWSLMILISSYAGLITIKENLFDYFQYAVITNSRRIRSESVTFPAVTICELSENNSNPNITNRIISAHFRGKELNVSDDFEPVKLRLENDCFRFNDQKKSGLDNLYKINPNDNLKSGLYLNLTNSISNVALV